MAGSPPFRTASYSSAAALPAPPADDAASADSSRCASLVRRRMRSLMLLVAASTDRSDCLPPSSMPSLRPLPARLPCSLMSSAARAMVCTASRAACSNGRTSMTIAVWTFFSCVIVSGLVGVLGNLGHGGLFHHTQVIQHVKPVCIAQPHAFHDRVRGAIVQADRPIEAGAPLRCHPVKQLPGRQVLGPDFNVFRWRVQVRQVKAVAPLGGALRGEARTRRGRQFPNRPSVMASRYFDITARAPPGCSSQKAMTCSRSKGASRSQASAILRM